MKLHWGNAIFLFFVVYIGILGFTLYQSTQVDHSLVADDYYAKDLAYQDQYEKLANYAASNAPLKARFDSKKETIALHAPGGDRTLSGIITFYHPAESNQDEQRRFSVPAGQEVLLSMPNLSSGRWIAQIEYEDQRKPYYFEKDIYVR